MNLNTLVDNCLSSTQKDRNEAFLNLMRAVKYIDQEGEPDQLIYLEEQLEHFVPYLITQEGDNLDGSTISIFRRVDLNSKTLCKLLELAEQGHYPLVVEALGFASENEWTTQIEIALVNSLTNSLTVSPAIYALYCRASLLVLETTMDKLQCFYDANNGHQSALSLPEGEQVLFILAQLKHVSKANKSTIKL